jgi:hypothetical protein
MVAPSMIHNPKSAKRSPQKRPPSRSNSQYPFLTPLGKFGKMIALKNNLP